MKYIKFKKGDRVITEFGTTGTIITDAPDHYWYMKVDDKNRGIRINDYSGLFVSETRLKLLPNVFRSLRQLANK